MKKTVSAITAMAIAGLLMCGCASGNASEGSKPTASERFSENVANEEQSGSETTQDLLDRIEAASSKAGATIEVFVRDREDSSANRRNRRMSQRHREPRCVAQGRTSLMASYLDPESSTPVVQQSCFACWKL